MFMFMFSIIRFPLKSAKSIFVFFLSFPLVNLSLQVA